MNVNTSVASLSIPLIEPRHRSKALESLAALLRLVATGEEHHLGREQLHPVLLSHQHADLLHTHHIVTHPFSIKGVRIM